MENANVAGELFVWGRGAEGQLGQNVSYYDNTPRQVTELGNSVVALSFGGYYSAALTKNGEVWTWGDGKNGQLGIHTEIGNTRIRTPTLMTIPAPETKVVMVQCGSYHTVVLNDNGVVFATGHNLYGQLGFLDEETRYTLEPVKLPHPAKLIACGVNHSAALLNTGDLYMWGDNQYFQLTRSDHNKETTPRKVNFELSAHICSISCELANHVDNGELFAWGNNQFGQVGVGKLGGNIASPTHVVLFSLAKVLSFQCCHRQSAIILRELLMCGESSDGKFGVPEKTSRNKPHLVNTLAGKRVKSLSMGGYFVIAVLVVTWGSFHNGSSFQVRWQPEEVIMPDRKRVIGTVCGFDHIGMIAIPAYPTWQELKPLLIGWSKDESCSFHYKTGVSLDVIQYIVELAWDCKLPALKVELV